MQLQQLQQRYAANGLKIVHLFLENSGADSTSTCRAWTSRTSITYPAVLVPSSYIFEVGGWSTPGYYLVGSDGRIIPKSGALETQVRGILGV
ncbi:MAG: hypothetical protein Q8Q09_19565 [Deltaproteobacteria bacterium]|nr:hypothetical protein [Deltaproteobacteria bacterium]